METFHTCPWGRLVIFRAIFGRNPASNGNELNREIEALPSSLNSAVTVCPPARPLPMPAPIGTALSMKARRSQRHMVDQANESPTKAGSRVRSRSGGKSTVLLTVQPTYKKHRPTQSDQPSNGPNGGESTLKKGTHLGRADDRGGRFPSNGYDMVKKPDRLDKFWVDSGTRLTMMSGPPNGPTVLELVRLCRSTPYSGRRLLGAVAANVSPDASLRFPPAQLTTACGLCPDGETVTQKCLADERTRGRTDREHVNTNEVLRPLRPTLTTPSGR